MGLNQNGQAITLSNKLLQAGARDGESLARLMASDKREYTFAQTFPTGTHAMWLYYWLAAHGIDPMRDAKAITVPPPQMVANMRVGNMDGFCVGEPWARARSWTRSASPPSRRRASGPTIPKGAGRQRRVRGAPSQHGAGRHGCGAGGGQVDRRFEANRQKTAETIAAKSYVNTDAGGIVGRMQGRYEDGLGKSWSDPHAMRFHADGEANFPYLSDGMWFLTQHKRWGLLKTHPDYLAVARQINRIDVYRQAAQAVGVALPAGEMRKSTLVDGVAWDGSDPAAYADGFKVKA